MISFASLLLVISAGMGMNVVISRLSKHYIYHAHRKSTTSSESSSASQQLLKPSPRRTQTLSTPTVSSPLASHQTPTHHAFVFVVGSILAAFMESFGLVYLFNALNVQTLSDALKVAWICWLFLCFPATILHFKYHWPPEGMRSEEETIRIMATQAARIISEALIMATLIILLRK